MANKIPKSLANWTRMEHDEVVTFSPEPVTAIVKLRQRMQNALDKLSQDDIRHLYDHLHVRLRACVAARGSTLYWYDC